MNKYFKHRHKIAHLSKDLQDELANKYYSGANVEELISTYNINISASSFYLVLPLKKDSKMLCPHCLSKMLCLPTSKSRQFAKEHICDTCWHIEGKYNCKCQNCILKKQDEAHTMKLKRAMQKSNTKTNLDSSKTIKIEKMNFIDKVYLGALLRTYIPTKDCFITATTQFESNLAPSIPLKNKIFDELLRKNIIFEITSSANDVTYAINILDICNNKDQLQSIVYPKKVHEISTELLQIIRDIQIYEAVEYFSIIASKQFSIDCIHQNTIDEMFYSLFMMILENNYSIGQLHYFIYSGVRNYAARHACTNHTTNLYLEIYDNVLKLYNKATIEKWDIKNYNRTYSTQPSELFKIVANELLSIKEELFYQPFKL